MKKQQTVGYYNPREVYLAAKRIVHMLIRRPQRHGNQGHALGVIPVVGLGDGSLEDSCRPAEPGDDFRDYNRYVNAQLDEHETPFVDIRPNRPGQKGVLVLDIDGNQSGSPQSLLPRGDLIFQAGELIARVFCQLGNKPGLILPSEDNRTRMIRPGSTEGLLLQRLNEARSQVAENGLTDSLVKLEKIRANLDFAIIISDFMSPNSNWEKQKQQLENIGRRLELIVFQVIDPWDLNLPDKKLRLGKIRVRQGGEDVTVDTEDDDARREYREKASLRQAEIIATLREARARHHKLMTTKLVLERLMQIFKSPQSLRKAA